MSAFSRNPDSLVASPKHRGSRPDASLSSDPVCPAFRARYIRAAKSAGEMSARALEYLDDVRHESERAPTAPCPEAALIRGEAQRVARRVIRAARLSSEEQRVVRLHFELGRSAREIADSEGFPGVRRVFTILERVRRRVRRQWERYGVADGD